MRFNESEQRCIHKLAEWFDLQRGGYFTPELLAEQLGIGLDESFRLANFADGLGLLTNVDHCDGHLAVFNIAVGAVELSREIHEAQRQAADQDRVEHAQSWIRRSPWTAYPLIVGLALMALVTFLNQAFELLERLGLAGKK